MRKFDKHGFGVAFRSFGILVLLFTMYIFVVHVLMPLTYAGVVKEVKTGTIHRHTSARRISSVDVDISKMNIEYVVDGRVYTVEHTADGLYNKGDTFSVRYKKENPNIHTFDKVELEVFVLCLGASLISFLLSGILFKRSKFV